MPETSQFLPLEKLLKFPRGRKHVTIDAALLPKLDLTVLQKTIHFGFNHNFRVSVEVSPYVQKLCFYLQMSIAPDETDWPEPTDSFCQLYCAALGVAAKQASTKDESDERCRHQVVIRQDHIIMLYNLVQAANGNDLAKILRRKLDLLRDELPAVIGVLADGPVPGTTVYDDDF